MPGSTLFGIEEQDLQTYLEVMDWWKRSSLAGAPPGNRFDYAEPLILLQRSTGWEAGWALPMVVDPVYPYSYEICVHGYPNVAEIGLSTSAFFRLVWNGQTSDPIQYDYSAAQFRDALPQELRDACKVSGGVMSWYKDLQNVLTANPGRWWMSFQAPFDLSLSADLTVTDAVKITITRSRYSAAAQPVQIWDLIAREMIPPVAIGSLCIGLWTQSSGLVLSGIEPRIFEGYTRFLPESSNA